MSSSEWNPRAVTITEEGNGIPAIYSLNFLLIAHDDSVPPDLLVSSENPSTWARVVGIPLIW